MDTDEANLAIIRRDWVEALQEGDVDRVISRLAPGVAWQGAEAHLVCRTRDDVARTLRDLGDGGLPRIARLELTPVEGGVVLSLAGPDFRPDGCPGLDGELHVLFRLDAGRITHLHDFRRRDEALAAARAPAPPVPEREPPEDHGPPPPERARAASLVPFVHVADVARSAGFYRLLGFEVRETYAPGVRLEWAALGHEDARIMLARADEPVDARRQAVLFYLHSHDLAGLRRHLLAHGVRAGPIVDGSPGPREEMRLEDPDGYVLMVAQAEDATGR